MEVLYIFFAIFFLFFKLYYIYLFFFVYSGWWFLWWIRIRKVCLFACSCCFSSQSHVITDQHKIHTKAFSLLNCTYTHTNILFFLPAIIVLNLFLSDEIYFRLALLISGLNFSNQGHSKLKPFCVQLLLYYYFY